MSSVGRKIFVLRRQADFVEIINARFEQDLVRKVDDLVRRGIFKNRSEALRRMTEDYVDRHPELFLDAEAEKWFKADIDDDELEEICAGLFRGKRTAAEIVGEGRGR